MIHWNKLYYTFSSFLTCQTHQCQWRKSLLKKAFPLSPGPWSILLCSEQRDDVAGDIQRALKVSAEHTLSGAVLMTLQHVLLLGHPDVSSRTHSLCSLPAYRLDPNRAGSSFGFTVEHCDSSTGHDTNPCGCDKDRCSDLLQGCWQKPE